MSNATAPKRKSFISHQPSFFKPLKFETLPKSDSIRLVQRHEHGIFGGFSFSLHMFHADEVPPYTALSYTWGPALVDQAPNDYEFHIVCDGYMHPVTENLFIALRRLSTNEGAFLWIDQICINQEDTAEKSAQVARMGMTFAKAEGVYVWLGEQDEAAEITYRTMADFLPAMGKARLKNRIQGGYVRYGDESFWSTIGLTPWTKEQVYAIIQFFNRSWFERAWTIQEVALANQTKVACGGLVLDWDYFSMFSYFLNDSGWVMALQKARDLLLAETKKIEIPSDGIIITRHTSPVASVPMAYNKLQSICKDVFSRGLLTKSSKVDQSLWQQNRKEFYDLLESCLAFFRFSKTTQPVDKVFAPLAVASQLLASDSKRAEYLLPDYESSVVDVYIRTCKLIIQETRSLSILSQVESSSYRNLQDLPSWVPDFSSRYLGLNLAASPRSFTLVPLFNALHGCSIVFNSTITCAKLSVSAILWDTVIETIPTSAGANFRSRPSLWFNLCSNLDDNYFNNQGRGEVLWRTMICDLGPDFERPAPTELEACFRSFVLLCLAKSVDMKTQLNNILTAGFESLLLPKVGMLFPSSTIKALPNISEVVDFVLQLVEGDGQPVDDKESFTRQYETFEKLYLHVKACRKMFRSSRNALGHGPDSLQDNDTIAFINGATVPFIVRRTETGNYRLVGETYVHGFMNGEIFQDKTLAFQQIELI